MSHLPFILFLFALGACVGSFLNVVVWRLPRGESLSHPPSHCPKCNTPLKWYDNLPVVGWVKLGGKCRTCREPISPRYPIVELVTAVLSTAVAIRFGWHWQTLAALVLTWSLIALTAIDLDHTILPDAITLPLLWLGLLASLAWHAGLKPPAPVDTHSAVVGAMKGGADYILAMTGGGPNGATNILALEIFTRTFLDLKFGIGTAMSWILGALLIGVTAYQLKMLSRAEFKARS